MLRNITANLQFFALLLLATGLSTSVFLMSLGGILLAISWLLYGNIAERFSKSIKEPFVLVSVLLFGFHLAGLAWTSDFQYAWNDIRIKIPVLLFPLLIYSLPKQDAKRNHLFLLLFVAATFVSTFISFGIYQGFIPTQKDISDIRNISPFVSHIRLSLVVCVAITVSIYLAVTIRHPLRYLAFALVSWFMYFLYLIESATGMAVLGGTLVFLVVYLLWKSGKKSIRLGGLSILTLVLVLVLYTGYRFVSEMRTPKENKHEFATHTASGEVYQHKSENNMLENGYYTWSNIAYTELKESWNSRASIPFDSLDKKQQPIAHTMIRYITSKGLRKDKEGVAQLSDADIHNIENGIANVNYLTKNGLRRRLEEIIFEIDAYYHTGNPSGNSVTQRVEFWLTGWQIFTEHVLFGVGTGDPQKEFLKKYEENKSILPLSSRLRSHNQFLAIAVAFGITGLVVFLMYLWIPFHQAWKENNLLFLLFFCGAVISFLTEDTLETQAGVSYFCFFSSWFLYQFRSGSSAQISR